MAVLYRKIQSALKLPDVVLIRPRSLRSANEQFVRERGYDLVQRPAVDNPLVSSIQFARSTKSDLPRFRKIQSS